MDEGAVNESTPDLRDIEMKLGRKTPEGLLRCLREEASSFRGEAKLAVAHDGGKETGKKSLDEKIRKLKMEMAHLRSVDVKILQQLLAVHEGIEAVKWLLEERSTLTSRCSSLTSSQYSLGEGPDTSWRGSWSSLHDPNDKLDNISIGSYLDTLADDMDEYCASSSESVICSGVPPVSEAVAGALTAGAPVAAAGAGVRSDTAARLRAVGSDHKIKVGSGTEVKGRPGSAVTGAVTGVTEAVNRKTVVSVNKTEGSKHDAPVWTKTADTIQTQSVKANNVLEKPAAQTGSPAKVNLSKKLGSSQSPKVKPYKNGKIEMDTCKINGKTHLEYDAHWRWVQSQEDVTFL